jgi:hypothetical protein
MSWSNSARSRAKFRLYPTNVLLAVRIESCGCVDPASSRVALRYTFFKLAAFRSAPPNREIYRENSRFALVRTMAASIHDFDQLVAAKFPARSEQGIFRGKQGLLKC